MSSITPSIGRKVWFYEPSLNAGIYSADQPFDATVIYVWGPNMVNLRVTDHAGQVSTRTSVPLRDPLEGDQHGKEYVATWMPYQVGQSKPAAA